MVKETDFELLQRLKNVLRGTDHLDLAEIYDETVPPDAMKQLDENRAWKRTRPLQVNLIGRNGYLCRHEEFPQLWRWRTNVIIASDEVAALRIFEEHAVKAADDSYWEQFGSARFTILIGKQRSKLYRHKIDPFLWKWKEYVVRATGPDQVDEMLKKMFQEKEG